METKSTLSADALSKLAANIKTWALELGFQQAGITDIDLQKAETRLHHWLQAGYHGQMHYMEKHGLKRSRPERLIPGTQRIISVRMDYWPDNQFNIMHLLDDKTYAYISRYALGRDYHKVLRKRLAKLVTRIETQVNLQTRIFVDSGPVLEKALAEKAGLGWIGKHTNLINKDGGSWFFLGEIYTNLALPIDTPASAHCGDCRQCIDICPTQAIVGEYQLDARRCISYLTIELRGSIPIELRTMIGNRIYGCDDCQAVCPWNRFASMSPEPDFKARQQLDTSSLLELFSWSEETFLTKTEGSAIRRIGYQCWLRNIAVALGNSDGGEAVVQALIKKLKQCSELVHEHIEWALSNLEN